MCGLVAGFASGNLSMSAAALQAALLRMTRRGPDGEGMWRDEKAVLGHRRLAIIDLDSRAMQPMHSPCGRYVIAYNGEIYNFPDLRHELEEQGVMFRTTSDTEVILALFGAHGESMLPRLHGMFAFVIWDRTEERAFVARDPYGIKPLYYAETSQGALIASQVKAARWCRASPTCKGRPDSGCWAACPSHIPGTTRSAPCLPGTARGSTRGASPPHAAGAISARLGDRPSPQH